MRLICYGGLLVSGLALRATEVVVSGPMVELPPMVIVSDHGPTWHYVEIPGYEILSCCPDEQTAEYLRGLARAESLLRYFVPTKYWARSDVPRVIILSTPQNLALMPRELLGEDLGEHTLMYGGESLTRGNSRMAPNIELGDRDQSMVFVTLDPVNFDPNRLMLHPGHVRDLLAQRRPALPDWVVAGVMNLYSGLYRAQTAELTEEYAVRTIDQQLFSTPIQGGKANRIGRDTTKVNYATDRDLFSVPPEVWVSDEATAALLKVLAHRTRADAEPGGAEAVGDAMPLQVILGPQPADESPEMPVWNAGAALLVRWALAAQGSTRAAAMWHFVDRVDDGAPTEAAFRDAFGLEFGQATRELNAYLPDALRRTTEFRVPAAAQARPEIRPATRTEILRVREDWTRLVAGYLKTRFPGATVPEKPHRLALQAWEKGNRDPRLLAAIGLYELDLERASSARTLLEAAADAGVVRPSAYLALARLRYRQAKDQDGGRLGPAQAKFVTAPLLRGLAQAPPLLEAYGLAAEVWLNSQAELGHTEIHLLEQGAAYFPGNLELLYQAALLASRNGQEDAAARLAQRGLSLARDPAQRTQFEALCPKAPAGG
ncbi:MAG TPA: hypothetical protein VL200_10435 [Lacunisphaera sp.]|nr:hypothetical protein [Lacunisphaera sp.]